MSLTPFCYCFFPLPLRSRDVMKKFVLRGVWHEHAVIKNLAVVQVMWNCYNERFGQRLGWWGRLDTSAQSSWRMIRLVWHLERGVWFIPINKLVWNVMSVSHDWKSTSFREDIVSMLRVLFLATMTSSTGYITENGIWKKVVNNKMLFIYYYSRGIDCLERW